MPTYEYQCKTCNHRFETWQKMTDEPLTICPECGGHIRRELFPAGIVFKGPGFYKTDHNGHSEASSNGHNSDAAKGEGVTGEKKTSSESKSTESSSDSSSVKRLFLVAPLLRRSLQVLDARTFLPLWTFQGKEKESSIGAMPAGGFVYVHADRAIHALAGSSGKEVWTRRTGSIPQAVDAWRLYYTYQNTDFKYFVQALDPWTGAPLGTLRIADAWLAPYGALTAGGGQLYVPVHKSHDFFSGFSNSQDSALCAVDGATGHKMWCSPWQYEYLNVAVYKEGLVFITSTGEGNRSSALYGLRGAPPNSYLP
jgi:putative FmdB family regulatory protein